MGVLISKLKTREINKEQFESQSNKLLSLHSLRNLSLTWSRNALNTITTRNYGSEKNSTNLIRKGIHIFKYFPMININCLIIHRQHGRHCMLTFPMENIKKMRKKNSKQLNSKNQMLTLTMTPQQHSMIKQKIKQKTNSDQKGNKRKFKCPSTYIKHKTKSCTTC